MDPSEPLTPETQSGTKPGSAPASNTPLPGFESSPEAAMAPAPSPKIIGYCRECGKALEETGVHRALGAIYCEQHRPAHVLPGQVSEVQATESQPGASQSSWSAPPAPQPPPLPSAASPYTAPPFHSSPGQSNAGYTNAGYTSPGYTSPAYHASQPQPFPSSSPQNTGGTPGLAFVAGMIPGVGAVYNGQYAKGLIHVVIFGMAISAIHSGYFAGFEPVIGLFIACFWFYMAFEAYHTARKQRAGVPVDEFSSVFPMRNRSARVPVGPLVLIALGVLFLLSNLEIIDVRRMMRYWPALLIVMGLYMIYVRLAAHAADTRPGAAAKEDNRDDR